MHEKGRIASEQNCIAESISRDFNMKTYAKARISDLKGKKKFHLLRIKCRSFQFWRKSYYVFHV